MALRFTAPRILTKLLAVWTVIFASQTCASAEIEPIEIPNGSFESPAILFVSTNLVAWRKTPKPPAYDESGGFFWDQLTGVFANTSAGASDHIDNCDGAQAGYLFAVPEVGLFQDYDTVDSYHSGPTHAFDAAFLTGNSYQLTFGVIAGGGNMREGVTLEAVLYYRDNSSNQVAVASTNIVFTREVFPNRTHLTEFQLRIPPVKAGDAWAGQHLGVRFLSTVSSEQQGGYWDLDNIRLFTLSPPRFLVTATPVGANLRLGWPSVRGYDYQIAVSDDLQNWANQGSPLSGTGTDLVTLIPRADVPRAFFRVLAAPSP